MSSRRILKAAEAIREVVSLSILTELRDPRIEDVTVTFVEVSPDMRHAKIHVSVMGNEAKQKLCLKGLSNAAGFLQQKVANRIDTRYTPKLRFVLDHGVKHSLEVTRILGELFPGEPSSVSERAEEATDEPSREAPATGDTSSGDTPTATEPKDVHIMREDLPGCSPGASP
ncbi:MAG: 30S ribosome-binding factor RbfA [Pirellulaceae bacterium]